MRARAQAEIDGEDLAPVSTEAEKPHDEQAVSRRPGQVSGVMQSEDTRARNVKGRRKIDGPMEAVRQEKINSFFCLLFYPGPQ